jgi:hypothetical protein
MGSVLEQILHQLTPGVSEQISRQLGVDQQTVQSAISLGVPVLVAALARNSSNPEGAASLSDALTRDHDGSILQDVPGAVRDYQDQPGEGILKHVLGDQRGEVGDALTQTTGADGSTVLQMLAPVVMGVLGDVQRQQHLDADGLATTLEHEREELVQSGGPLAGMGPQPAGGPQQASDPAADLLGQYLR